MDKTSKQQQQPPPPPPDHTVTDRQLRVAAEEAAGQSGTLYLLRDDKGGLVLSEKPPTAGNAIFKVTRDKELPPREGKVKVSFQAPDMKDPKPVEGIYDALFWSGAAFEKFLLTYYGSLRLLSADRMARLNAAINDPKVLALAHTPKSEPVDIDDPDALLMHLHAFQARPGIDGGGQWVPITKYPLP